MSHAFAAFRSKLLNDVLFVPSLSPLTRLSRAQYNQQQGPVSSAVNMGPVVGHANGFGGQQQPPQQQQQQMSMNQVVGNGSVGQQAHTSNLQMLNRQMSAGPEPRPQMHMQRQLSVGAQSMNQQHAYQGSHGF